ncbi:MAG: helix-turn-helix domain-containing protein [Parabacteroides gordonii]|uniref:helix-turn-helix domain-containing protein n=1 Tax=Parabacteroides gordonii TaxID=574930 RepID=UPI003A83FD0F
MMNMELSSSGRRNIRLEVPEITYFPLSATGQLEELSWSVRQDFFQCDYSEFKCKDFNIIRNSICCEQDCCLRSQNMDCAFLGLSSVQQGRAECFLSSGRDRRIWSKGYSNIMVCSGYKEELNHFRAGETFGMTSVLISPEFFRYLTERYPEFFEKPYERLAQGDTFFLAPENIPVSTLLTTALGDIQHCRNMGNASRMYLEAKVVECLSVFIREATDQDVKRERALSVSDRDKIYQARDIICAEYLDPPSLHTLARRVGTNECTLKAGFKRAFRTTIFNYLYNYRMNMAVHYLLDTDKTIAEVAGLVGYDYQGHFCTAFKRKFNLSPSEYRLKA